MGSNKTRTKTVAVVLLLLLSIRLCAQDLASDSILAKYRGLKERIENRLDNYRLMHAGSWDFCFDIYYHEYYPESQSRYHKGIDLSLDGMVDSAMRQRIIQLLNDEFSDGEYERWIDSLMKMYLLRFKNREEAIEYTKEKKWNECDVYHVIKLCGGLKDEEIKNILIKFYKDKDNNIYDLYRKVTLEALARMRVEPYLSMFVEKNKYRESDNPEDMDDSLFKLYRLPCKETLLEVSRYLSSDKYAVSYIEADSIAGDFVYEEEIELVPIEIEYPGSDYNGSVCHDYIRTTAFLYLARHILNPELLSIVGVKRDEELFLYSTREKLDALLTPRKCKKIQRWMRKNYNNYDLSGSW